MICNYEKIEGNERMREYLILVIEFISLYFCYFFIYRIVFNAQFKKSILQAVIVMVIACASGVLMWRIIKDYIPTEELIYFITITVAMTILAEKNKAYVLALSPIVFFLLSEILSMITYLDSLLTKKSYTEIMRINDNRIVFYTIAFILLLVVYFALRKKRNSKIWIVNVGEYCLLLFTGLCFSVVLGTTQSIVLGSYLVSNSVFMQFTALSCCVLGMIMYSSLIWQIILKGRIIEYKEKEKRYSEYLAMQDARIKEIIESDIKMRRFKHDIRAHITALEAGIEKKDIVLVSEYVKRMREDEKKYELKRYTGIASLDALISEAQKRADSIGISWRYVGDKNILIDENYIYDLCVIISNLMNNAIEGTDKTSEDIEKVVEIGISKLLGKVVISVKNTCMENFSIDGIEHTDKNDDVNHGFGIENIKETVSRYEGEVIFNVENGVFSAKVIL